MPLWWIYDNLDGLSGPWKDTDIIHFVKIGHLKNDHKLRMESQDTWLTAEEIVEHIQRLAAPSAEVAVQAVVPKNHSSNGAAPVTQTLPIEVGSALLRCMSVLFIRKADLVLFLKNNSLDVRALTDNITTMSIAQVAKLAIDAIGKSPNANVLLHELVLSLVRTHDPAKWNGNQTKNHETVARSLEELHQAYRNTRDKQVRTKLEQLTREHQEKLAEQKRALLLSELTRLANAVPKEMTAQKRGIAFEALLHKLFELEGIEASGSICTATQQHDNRIYLDGENYIIEAKWEKTPTSTEKANHFHTKVDGVFYGRGVLVSMSGFSAGLVGDLTRGKAVKLILFDQMDIASIFEGRMSFKMTLARKVKAAQTLGQIYFDALTESQKAN